MLSAARTGGEYFAFRMASQATVKVFGNPVSRPHLPWSNGQTHVESALELSTEDDAEPIYESNDTRQLKQFYKLKQANRGENEHIAYAAEMLLLMVQRISIGQSLVNELAPGRFSSHVPVVNEIAGFFYVLLQGKQGAPASAPTQQTLVQQAPSARSISRPLRVTRPAPPPQAGS